MQTSKLVYVYRAALPVTAVLVLEYILFWTFNANTSWYIGILLHNIAMVVFIGDLMSPNTSELGGIAGLLAVIAAILTVGINVWTYSDPFIRFLFPLFNGMLSVVVSLYCITFFGVIIWGDKFEPHTAQPA